MTLSWIGALVLFALPKAKPQQDLQRAYDCLSREYEQLRHGREQLVATIELLEREAATQRSMADHWLRELQRTIRERREIENERDRLRAQVQSYAPNPHPLHGAAINEQGALLNMAQAQHAQLQAQRNAFAQQFDGYCNCVPGRSQLINSVHSLNQT